ncbi:MAG TPA: pyridoxamine 5'-phosphate oxidase family protein [Roseiflexaceae bacterium]|nr:pyridoxamine 5'-phosphate oxidase family protein [Roseiflexaceae bacterium]
MPVEPTTGRPHMPPGYISPEAQGALMPWSSAREHWEWARVYWICTVRPNGRPHVSPVWGVWVDDVLYFDGSPETRRMRNIAANPHIAVHLDSDSAGNEAFTAEGIAHAVQRPDRALAERIAAAYRAKYAADGYAPEPGQWDEGGLYAMQPRVALGWTSFLKDATRWQFDR